MWCGGDFIWGKGVRVGGCLGVCCEYVRWGVFCGFSGCWFLGEDGPDGVGWDWVVLWCVVFIVA